MGLLIFLRDLCGYTCMGSHVNMVEKERGSIEMKENVEQGEK